jgi:hypothetical protein
MEPILNIQETGRATRRNEANRLRKRRSKARSSSWWQGGMIVMSGFCALAVDYGRSVIVKNQLQRACDAAALSGAEYLPGYPDFAKVAAVYYAYQNNGVVVDPNRIVIDNNRYRIRVPATQRVQYFFAPVMKVFSGNVTTSARVAITQRDNMLPPNVVPIGITPSTYEQAKDGRQVDIEAIRQNKEDLDIYDFVMMDLRDGSNGKAPAQMQDQLQWGTQFDEVTRVGGSETTLNAANPSQANHFERGMQSRFDAAVGFNDNGDKFTKIPPGSPRMMYFIVTPEQQAVNGTNNARVVGFAPVYVERMVVGQDPVTKEDVIKLRVRFLPMDYNAGGNFSDVTTNDPDARSFHLKRLVD